MSELTDNTMLVIAAESELPLSQRIWGTGGWLPPEARPPEDREALDWLTLARFMGWGVTVVRRTGDGFERNLASGSRYVVIACDPDGLTHEAIAELESRVSDEVLLVIARAGKDGGDFRRFSGVGHREVLFSGRRLRWIALGAERVWECRQGLSASHLSLSQDSTVWATLDGAPVIAARKKGRSVIVTLGFHPSAWRDCDGAATALLKHLLVNGACSPIAWVDLAGSLVLRMDDPGGAQNVHCREWSYPKLTESDWSEIEADLQRRKARLSICYVAGWLDDGDARRGTLTVAGEETSRIAGRVHPSPLVKYRDLTGNAPGVVHDYEAEFRGIEYLRASETGDVELHGYTHMHPDAAAWACADDRYENFRWYRELGSAAADTLSKLKPEEHPLSLGIKAFEKHFNSRPTTLICPGDEWTEDVIESALDLGFSFVGDYHLAIRDHDRFCWTSHVCAPYLDSPEASWFRTELPVVGYFHDREPALEGVAWMSRWLDEWQAAGAERLMDFRELAAIVHRRFRLEERDGELRLDVLADARTPRLVRPLRVLLNLPAERLPSCLLACDGERKITLAVTRTGDSQGYVIVPPDFAAPLVSVVRTRAGSQSLSRA